jgi:hypothetical protein
MPVDRRIARRFVNACQRTEDRELASTNLDVVAVSVVTLWRLCPSSDRGGLLLDPPYGRARAPVETPLRRGGIVGARSVYRGVPFGPSRHNQKSLNQHQASRYGTDESINFGIGGAITI